jgi:transposase-like protein
MTGHGTKISTKQETAIAALLSASSITAAAKEAGLGEKTLRRWLKDEGFKRALDEARREVLAQTIANLLRASSRAVNVLIGLLESEAEGIRLRAALGLVDRAMEMVAYLNLETRLESVEEQLKQRRF